MLIGTFSTFDGAADFSIDSCAHRDPLVQLHNHLRYNFTPATSVALGKQW